MAVLDTKDALLATWETSNRVTAFLIENLPDEVWHHAIPGAPRRTVQMIGGHLHNCRCMWIKMLGQKHGLAVPRNVNRHRVSRAQLGHRLPAEVTNGLWQWAKRRREIRG